MQQQFSFIQKEEFKISDQTRIAPSDLFSSDPLFYDEIKNSGFNQRWKTQGQKKYRVLTIEGNSEPPSQNNLKIFPLQLFSNSPNFSQGIASSYFNWRWYPADDGIRYRTVTIENGKNEHINKNIETFVNVENLLWFSGRKNDLNDLVIDQDKQQWFNWSVLKKRNKIWVPVKYRVVFLE